MKIVLSSLGNGVPNPPFKFKFKFNFKVKTLGCHPNWPQGWLIAATLKNPGLF
jgi:hypothetical protein